MLTKEPGTFRAMTRHVRCTREHDNDFSVPTRFIGVASTNIATACPRTSLCLRLCLFECHVGLVIGSVGVAAHCAFHGVASGSAATGWPLASPLP